MKVHLGGAWGRGRYGDDCGVEAFKASLRSVWTDVDFVQHAGGGVFSPACQDGEILTGASLLDPDLKRHFRYAAAMQLFGKPTFLVGLRVPAVLSPSHVGPYLPIFDQARVLTVSDRESAARLTEAGVQVPALRSADPAYLGARCPRPRAARMARRPTLGVAVRGFEPRVGEALARLDGEFELKLFSFDAEEGDAAPHRAYRGVDDLPIFEDAVLRTDVLLTSRFEAVVLAARCAMPIVGVGAPEGSVERECRALGHPPFVACDRPADEIVEAVRTTWAASEEASESLDRAAERQRTWARRSVDLTVAGFDATRDPRPRLPGGKRRLVIWAAPDEFFPEVRPVLDAWGRFDMLVSIHSRASHRNVAERLVAPPPGLIHWETFPVSLRNRIEAAYSGVVVFHPGRPLRSSAADVAERSRSPRSGPAWEFSTWTHEAMELDPAVRWAGVAA